MHYDRFSGVTKKFSVLTVVGVFLLSGLASSLVPVLLSRNASAATPGSVLINEFSSNNSPEWVELYNSTDQPINLSDWYIKNAATSTPKKSLSGSIEAYGFRTLDINSGYLNNNDDTITLFDGLEQVIDSVVYGAGTIPAPSAGHSTNRTTDGGTTWATTSTPTKETSNAPTSTSTSPVLNVENFNTYNGSYKGINVGFNISDFENVSAVTVDLYSGTTLLTSNTHNDKLLNLIAGGTKQLSTPFIIQNDDYVEEFWTLGDFTYTEASKPTKSVVTVTGDNGSVSRELTSLDEPNGWSYESLLPPPTLPVDKQAPGSTNLTFEPFVGDNTGQTLKVGLNITDETGVDERVKYTYIRFKYQGKEYSYGFTNVSGTRYEAVIDTKNIVPVNQFGAVDISFAFRDTLGNNRSWKPEPYRTIGIDNSGPGSGLVSPTTGSYVKGSVPLNFSFTDHTGVKSAGVTLKHLETGAQRSFTVENITDTTGSVTINTTTMANGAWQVDLRPIDTFGTARYGSNRGVIIIDNEKPTAVLSQPGVSAFNPTTITVDAADNLALNRITANIYVEAGATLLKSCSESAPTDTTTYTLTCDVPELADGVYTIKANANDKTGATSNTTIRQFTIDTADPTFSISSPANNATVSGTQIINAQIADASGIHKVLMTVPFKNGTKTFVYEDGKTNNTLTRIGDVYSVSINTKDMHDGQTHIVLRGTDKAGNTRYWNNNASYRQHSFSVDNTGPSIGNKNPAENAVISGQYKVSITVSDPAGIQDGSVYVRFRDDNGNEYTYYLEKEGDSNIYSKVIDTTAIGNGSTGPNRVSFRAIDGQGNPRSSVSDGVIIDNAAPEIITNFVNGVTIEGTTTFTASTNEPATIAFEVYGESETLSDSATSEAGQSTFDYSLDTTKLANGAYRIVVRATDASGNVSEVSQNYTVFSPVPDSTPADANGVNPGVVLGAVNLPGVAPRNNLFAATRFNSNLPVSEGAVVPAEEVPDTPGRVKSDTIVNDQPVQEKEIVANVSTSSSWAWVWIVVLLAALTAVYYGYRNWKSHETRD